LDSVDEKIVDRKNHSQMQRGGYGLVIREGIRFLEVTIIPPIPWISHTKLTRHFVWNTLIMTQDSFKGYARNRGILHFIFLKYCNLKTLLDVQK
jgi:hypothetical protein